MSFFSAACETAIRLIIYVHAHGREGKKLGVQEIAKHTDTPVAYTAKIMQVLSRKGLVSSSRGLHGGFYLDRRSPDINLLSVVIAIDGIGFLQGCGLGLKRCSALHPCPMHHEFTLIRGQLEETLKKTSIANLAAKFSANLCHLTLNDILH